MPSHIVFNAEAYILFYARMNSPSTSSKQSECSSQQVVVLSMLFYVVATVYQCIILSSPIMVTDEEYHTAVV